MTDIGITALGVHVPVNRLSRLAIAQAHAWLSPGSAPRGKGEIAFCNWDEDVITMAVEAARQCVPATERRGVTRTILASTHLPFADLSNCGIVANALGLDQDVPAADCAGTLRAGLATLAGAMADGHDGALVIASDAPNGRPGGPLEPKLGHAAVAMQVGRHGVLAAFRGRVSRTVPFVDHFRAHDSDFDYAWEDRWVRDEGFAKVAVQAVRDALAGAGLEPEQVKFLLADSPVGGAEKALAKAAGLVGAQFVEDPQQRCGLTGTAAPLLQLALALERAEAGDIIVACAFGYGCDVLILEVTQAAVARRVAAASRSLDQGIAETAYLRFLCYNGSVKLDFGMRAEADAKTSLTQAYRSAHQLNAFVGGSCKACSTVQFPTLAACVKCGSDAGFDPHPLADEHAVVVTCTTDNLSFHLSPPFNMGLLEFTSGARVFMEIVDVPHGVEIETGTPLRMVFRRKDVDEKRGYTRYFWKATTCR